MGLLRFVGVQAPKPGDDTIADRAIREVLEAANNAHKRLREHLRNEPGFVGIICRALGCTDPECVAPLPVVQERIEQIPPIVDKLAEGTSPILPAAHD
jgi:hypothetical protein